MNWLSQNWFWLLIGAVFVFMHLGGHGGHGGHGSRAPEKPREKNAGDPPREAAFDEADKGRPSTGHQH